VLYIIAAGADPTSIDVNSLTPLDACLEFEEEQTLWARYHELELPDWYWLDHMGLPSNWRGLRTGGVRRQDNNQPWIRSSQDLQQALNRQPRGPRPEDSSRIAPVMNQDEGKQVIQDLITKGIRHCEIRGLEYTKSYLVGLRVDPATNNHNVDKCIQSSQFDLEKHFGKRHD
jgi:hypothetical protein